MIIKWILGLALLGHGIGHSTGFMAAWTKIEMGFTKSPWLFSENIVLSSPLGKFFGVLWLAAMGLLALSGYGLLTNHSWWVNLAIIGAVLSLICVLPWWNTVVSGAKAGAIFDVLLLAFLLTPLKNWLLNLIQR